MLIAGIISERERIREILSPHCKKKRTNIIQREIVPIKPATTATTVRIKFASLLSNNTFRHTPIIKKQINAVDDRKINSQGDNYLLEQLSSSDLRWQVVLTSK